MNHTYTAHSARSTIQSVLLLVFFIGSLAPFATAQHAWYENERFQPQQRIEITLTNPLDISGTDIPVTLTRDDLPITDIHEMDITLVDPDAEPRGEPTLEELRERGSHLTSAEQNGRMIEVQLDDLTKNGLWDELFFVTDLEAGQTRTLHLYIGYNSSGLFPHATSAGMGSYVRHMVPYWEAEHVGWKLWYPTDVDVYAKRTPQLMANHMITNNVDGYTVPHEMGNDIMFVQSTLGGGGIVLFEHPEQPDLVSRPRFTPVREQTDPNRPYNAGQERDTRYSFDVVANGPLRSIILARTFNWFSGNGFYELEQVYTAYARQSFSTVDATFTRFVPGHEGTRMGAGMRVHPEEDLFYHEENLVVSGGSEDIASPGDPDGLNTVSVDFTVHAFAVPSQYSPEFQKVEDYGGNYTFRIGAPQDQSFRYIMGSAWSEADVFESEQAFIDYMKSAVRRMEEPVRVAVGPVESR